MVADGEGVKQRSELRAVVAQLTHVEALSKSAFLLSAPVDATEGAGLEGKEKAKQAVVQVEVLKPQLSAEDPEVLRRLLDTSLAEDTQGAWFSNDRFCKKTVVGACDAVVEVVYPADARDVFKRKSVELSRRSETPELYASVTYPRLVAKAAQKDAWVRNIIEGRKEQEHVVAELGCEQVLVVKDYKWQDTSNADNLYYLALFKDLSVRSLRDLRGGKHLEVMRRIRDEIVVGLAAKHEVPAERLLAYVHYHPTFWYFHVHIVNCMHAMFSGEGSQNLLLSAMDRFHKIDTIITLLEADGSYYESARLPILVQPHQLPWYSQEKSNSAEPSVKRHKTAQE